jgi:hypothetical protein
MDTEKAPFPLKSRLLARKSLLFCQKVGFSDKKKLFFQPPYFPIFTQFPTAPKAYSAYWLQFPYSFMATLPTAYIVNKRGRQSCVVVGLDPNCQQLYEVALNLSRALTGWGTGGFFLKPPRLTLS